ncbi:hypothetical protein [Streptomyces sp. T028]|uniref:hypothetical protein n=1 Tax=Streptomyces sp. T028 TaxID=3394379 RepID=UPI003A89484A
MSTLAWIATAVAMLAVLGLGFNLPDHWFCGLLALAAVLGAADAAYREQRGWALGLLALAVLFSGGGLHAALRPGRERGPR